MFPERIGKKRVQKRMVDLNTQDVMEVKVAEPSASSGPSYCAGMPSFHVLAKDLDQPAVDTPKLATMQF